MGEVVAEPVPCYQWHAAAEDGVVGAKVPAADRGMLSSSTETTEDEEAEVCCFVAYLQQQLTDITT